MRWEKTNLTTTGAGLLTVEVHPGNIFPTGAIPGEETQLIISSLSSGIYPARFQCEQYWEYSVRSFLSEQHWHLLGEGGLMRSDQISDKILSLLASPRTSRLHPEPGSLGGWETVILPWSADRGIIRIILTELKQKDVALTSAKPSSRRFPVMVSSLTIQTRTVPHSLHSFEQSWDCAMFLSSGSRKVFAISDLRRRCYCDTFLDVFY